MVTKLAPGKIILFGEHAVVYGKPAIASPLEDLGATAHVSPLATKETGRILIKAPDIGQTIWLHEARPDDPLGQAVSLTLHAASIDRPPSLDVQVSSSIPVASGMGSGVAVTVAVIRALIAYLGLEWSNEKVSSVAYEVEKLHHGTPSGIDNTVVSYGQTIYFQKDSGPEFMHIGQPFEIVIGHTGVSAPTSTAVRMVRSARDVSPAQFEAFFERIGEIAEQARTCFQEGDLVQIGGLMRENQLILEKIGVSSKEIDLLNLAAEEAGALGAKLSGGGMGGIIIALPPENQGGTIADALEEAGASTVLRTWIRR